MSKDKPIIIQEPQKLRKDLHKIIDKTYKLGYNQALKDFGDKINKNVPLWMIKEIIEGLKKK